MVIFNNAKEALSLDSTIRENSRIQLINYSGTPFNNVGEIFQRAMDFVNTELVTFWDDDDIFLPNHLEQGVAGYDRGRGYLAYKPKFSYYKDSNGITLAENTLEPSIFVQTGLVKVYGFHSTNATYHHKWLNILEEADKLFIDPNGIPTLIYDWSGQIPVHKISGNDVPGNYVQHAEQSQDHGDGIITPDPLYLSWFTGTPYEVKPTEPLTGATSRKMILSVDMIDYKLDSLGHCTLSLTRDLQCELEDLNYRNYFDYILLGHTPTKDENQLIDKLLKIGGQLRVLDDEGQTQIYEKKESRYTEDDIRFITVQPDDRNWAWESEVQINNLRKWGLSNKFIICVHWNDLEKRCVNQDWLDLKMKYPEVTFKFFRRTIAADKIRTYLSVIRPNCLKRLWEEMPELKEKVIFYMDGDVIFIDRPKVEEMIRDEMSFVTNTAHYLGYNHYLKAKRDQVDEPELLPSTYFLDIISANCPQAPTSEFLRTDHKAGGAQYVLKNITSQFWERVESSCIEIRKDLAAANQKHFYKRAQQEGLSLENAGVQSWCADMWAMWGTMLSQGIEWEAPTWMDSVWASDHVTRLQGDKKGVFILHNTGIDADSARYSFQKLHYRADNIYPNEWPWFNNTLTHVSDQYCSWYYAEALKSAYPDKFGNSSLQ